MSHVVVVGAGIAGLAAAYELVGAGAGPTTRPTVTVLEADGVPGGKLRTTRVGDRMVDVGPDGFLARRPEATALIGELGATDRLEGVAASGAWIFARGRLRALPAGLALGVPTRLRDVRTREMVGILGFAGALRAATDLVAPRPARRSALPDRAIGPLVADKLGRRVVETLVDPLVGGIHAGRANDLSAAAVYPLVLAAGQRRGSLMRALRDLAPTPPADQAAADGARPPAFLSLADGLGSLPGMVTAALEAHGATVRTGAAVTAVHRGDPGAPRWVVEAAGERLSCDAVIVATPPAAAAALLGGHDADAAAMLASIAMADVAVVTLRLDAADVELPEHGTGILVPSHTPFGNDTFCTSAVSFLDRKWPHLARDGEVLVRVSVGRIDDVRFDDLDDAALTARLTDELGVLTGAAGAPIESIVTRWPRSFPQYRVNHLVRVDGIRSAVAALGGMSVCGAAYRGVGVPACIESGRAAARDVRAWIAAQS